MLNSTYQHTLKEIVTVQGVGVHSGATVTMTIKPAAASSGIVFIRTDITDRDNVIPARWDHVADTRLCTVIANKAGANVSTLEHIMSALAALGVDNAEIDIDNAEVPIMDGSAATFVEAIEKTGLLRQNVARRVLVVKKTVTIQDGDKEVILSPADGQYFGFEIEFGSNAIGRQKYTWQMKANSFRKEIAAARTFGFLHEVEALRKMGLARGGSLDNAIVIDGDTVMNPDGLRFKNEFVRHKILDAVGDLYLAGAQLIGHYHGVKAGHAMNNRILHALFADPSAYAFVDMVEAPVTRASGSRAAAGMPVPALA